MSEEIKSIHAFDFSLICEYFSSMERQGPGSPEMTVRALSFIDKLSKDSRIADIGCGTGGQTLVMADNAPGRITGVDLFPAFIDIFNANAARRNLQDRVKGIVASMDKLPFQDEELDLIWSEGSIYNIGFERGLNEWRRFLKPGGHIAVSEASWFTEERPEEIEKFWADAYPQIATIPVKLGQMQKAGYAPKAAFMLPESCWLEQFYVPQVVAQEKFLAKHPDNEAAQNLVANERREAELYRKYKKYYGYAFYIGQKL